MVFGEDTTVKGDVAALGAIVTQNPDDIDGERIQLSEPKNLLSLDIRTYDPQAQGQTYAPYSPSLAKVEDGRARHNGNLTLNNLTLERGVLFVDGDLRITERFPGCSG